MQRNFAHALRAERRAAGLTQDELAARSGVSQSSVSALERGFRTVPDQSTVEKLQTVLPLQAWTAARAAFEALARSAGQTTEEFLESMRRSDADYAASPGGRADYDAAGGRIDEGDTTTPVFSSISHVRPADLQPAA